MTNTYRKTIDGLSVELVVLGEYEYSGRIHLRVTHSARSRAIPLVYHCNVWDFYNCDEFTESTSGVLTPLWSEVQRNKKLDIQHSSLADIGGLEFLHRTESDNWTIKPTVVVADTQSENGEHNKNGNIYNKYINGDIRQLYIDRVYDEEGETQVDILDVNDITAVYFCKMSDFMGNTRFNLGQLNRLIVSKSATPFIEYKTPEYKFDEPIYLDEIKKYVDSTYFGHYGLDKIQATEIINDAGYGEAFALGNVIKYSKRYGKKDGKNRKDLLKIIHYAMIALYNRDNNLLEEDPEATKKT